MSEALRPGPALAVRVGVASHNLFDIALAHEIATDRGVQEALDVEMLQGMSPAQARAVRDEVGRVILYTPVVAREDFDVAIAYLIRRLEENAAGQNFLHALFAESAHAARTADEDGDAAGHPGSARQPRPQGLAAQREAFLTSVRESETVSTDRRRLPRPGDLPDPAGGFRNVPDTDPAVVESRRWAADLLTREVPDPEFTVVRSVEDVDEVVARADGVCVQWGATAPKDRAEVLRRAAVHLEEARGDLVATMVQEAGKTVAEADPEVSEAVDFALYYAEQADLLADGTVPGAVFRPHGVTVVTPPWNFPVAIPVGSVLAALAAGSPVLIKPAHPTPRSAGVAMAAIQRALDELDAPKHALQVLRAPEGGVGSHLVGHPSVTRVLLTGSIETAALFSSWREDLDVLAETSGKNAIVVTPAADVDLAVADVVRSAFGHAGQKCSAASLLILVGTAGYSDRLRRQLADSVTSLSVGPAT